MGEVDGRWGVGAETKRNDRAGQGRLEKFKRGWWMRNREEGG